MRLDDKDEAQKAGGGFGGGTDKGKESPGLGETPKESKPPSEKK